MKYLNTNTIRLRIGLLVFTLLSSLGNLMSQTSTSSDGNWNTGANWSSGVPDSKTKATVTNDMDMNVSITIEKNGGDRGEIVVNGGSIDGSGTGNDMTLTGTGYLEVGGNVTIGGDFELSNDAEFLIKSCDTLRIEGDVLVQNNSFFEIEVCGVLYVEGNLEIQNNNNSTVDGNIYVEGDLLIKNNAVMAGVGNIEVEGDVDIDNAGTIFGSTSACNPGPCEYGSGTGLPITLGKLEASYVSLKDVQLKWTTISEINNDYFTIYYSTDGKAFNYYSDIRGAGNSYQKKDYQLTITHPTYIKYIKLKQTDFDGNSKEYGPYKVATQNSNSKNESLVIAPNPGNGRFLTAQFKNISNGYYNLEIIDASGKIRMKRTLEVRGEDNNLKIELLGNAQLEKGIYYLRLNSHLEQFSKIILVQ